MSRLSGGVRFILNGAFISAINFFYSLLILKYDSTVSYTAFSLFLVINGFFINLTNSIQAGLSNKTIKKSYTLWLNILLLASFSIPFSVIPFAITIEDGVILFSLALFSGCIRHALKSTLFTYGYIETSNAADLLHIVIQMIVTLLFILVGMGIFISILYANLVSSFISIFYCIFKDLSKIPFFISARRFKIIFLNSIQPSLYAVITELMSNSVPYYIALAHGAVAYTSVAIATLFFRPLSVILSYTNQYIRIRVKMITQKAKSEIYKKMFTVNFLFLFIAFFCFISFRFLSDLYTSDVAISFIILLFIMFLRILRQRITIDVTEVFGFKIINKYVTTSCFIGLPFLLISFIKVEFALIATLIAEAIFCILLYKKSLSLEIIK